RLVRLDGELDELGVRRTGTVALGLEDALDRLAVRIGDVEGYAAVAEGGLELLHARVEVRLRHVEPRHRDEARELDLLALLPELAGVDLDAVLAVHDHERALDGAERLHGLAAEV